MKSLVKRVLSGVSTAVLLLCLLSGCALFVRDCGEAEAFTQEYSNVSVSDVESFAALENNSSDP